MEKLKKQNQTVNLPHKNNKLLLIKVLIIIEIIKIILTRKVILIIITIIITIITKRTGRYRTLTQQPTRSSVRYYIITIKAFK